MQRMRPERAGGGDSCLYRLELDEHDNEVSKGVFVCKVQGIEMHGGQPCPRFGLGGDGS